MNVEGIVAIWKEKGYTSHDVVAKTRKILDIKKIGHSGTLDPEVEGVLPLSVGRATRLIEYLQEAPKEYHATLLIGMSSTTQDLTGEIIQEKSTRELDENTVEEKMMSFLGEIEQVPPMYSAVKMNGIKLYELARKGIYIERKSKTVRIFNIQIFKIEKKDNTTEVTFNVKCSKGTYIRTLCEDIGIKLGYPALMKSLIRTASGNISRNQCVTLSELENLVNNEKIKTCLLPLDFAVKDFTKIVLDEIQAVKLFQGQKAQLGLSSQNIKLTDNQIIRVYDLNQHFIGIAKWEHLSESLVAVKMFAL